MDEDPDRYMVSLRFTGVLRCQTKTVCAMAV